MRVIAVRHLIGIQGSVTGSRGSPGSNHGSTGRIEACASSLHLITPHRQLCIRKRGIRAAFSMPGVLLCHGFHIITVWQPVCRIMQVRDVGHYANGGEDLRGQTDGEPTDAGS